jgi:hypothetical protein
MNYEISKIRKKTSGMALQNTWKIRYYVNGFLKVKNTYTPDVDQAIEIRDRFFDELRAKGATEKLVGTANPKAVRIPKPLTKDTYVQLRKPYVVNVLGKYLGVFDTLEEALACRDRHLKRIGHSLNSPKPTTV